MATFKFVFQYKFSCSLDKIKLYFQQDILGLVCLVLFLVFFLFSLPTSGRGDTATREEGEGGLEKREGREKKGSTAGVWGGVPCHT